MNERQLKVKERVLELLLDEDIQQGSVLHEIEKLSESLESRCFCSELLKFFIHTAFEEEEAGMHWDKIFENYDFFANNLRHNVGLRVAIFDYFVNLIKVVSRPIMVEIHVFKEAEKLAMVDGLTGIFNRRYFEISMKKETKRALRYGKTLSLLIIDLDDFKAINDTKGHPFGDDVLKRLAAILTSISREEDIPCRYGGEEFVVIMPETNANGALIFAERLRAGMHAEALFLDNRITCSGGVATYPDTSGAIEDLLKNADKALYEAKLSGKDRCMVSRNS